MSALNQLECGWCGDIAFQSLTGEFFDGDGGSCVSCGFPGQICVDTEHEAHWIVRDDDPILVAGWVKTHPSLVARLGVQLDPDETAALAALGR